MAWNEPGGGRDQDPWGSRRKQDGPPDLDELVRKLQDKFGGLFGGKRGGGSQGGSGGGTSAFGFGLIAIVLALVWVLSGIYIVGPGERGVVLRFGQYSTTTAPGPHWHVPYPVEKVFKVNVTQVRKVNHKAQMLTRDENIISLGLAVHYQISGAEDYLFKVRSPDNTLRDATESALREVVGSRLMDEVLSGGRAVLVNETKEKIQEISDRYGTGLRVTSVNLQDPQPPDEVQDAFQDAIKAREDQQRFKNQAEAYANDILPKAEGDAQRIEEEAQAYKLQVTERAEGETSRFKQTLTEYLRAPEVTRQRLYIETIEEVLANSTKVLIKLDKGNNIMYLPLDRYLRSGTGSVGMSSDSSSESESVPLQSQTSSRRGLLREREGR